MACSGFWGGGRPSNLRCVGELAVIKAMRLLCGNRRALHRRFSTRLADLTPLTNNIGALGNLAGRALTPVQVESLHEAVAHHGAVALRGVPFATLDEFLEFARTFGTPARVGASQSDVQLYVAKGTEQTRAPRGSDHFHSDNSYLERPAALTLLYLIDGAHSTRTELCDAGYAWDTLDETTRALIETPSLMGVHASDHNAGAPPPTLGRGEMQPSRRTAMHPLVRSQPHTGRPALYVNPLYTVCVHATKGAAPFPPADGERLLSGCMTHLLAPQHRSAFEWRAPGDLLIVDNSRMLHRAGTRDMPPGSVRRMLRISIAGGPPMPYGKAAPAVGVAPRHPARGPASSTFGTRVAHLSTWSAAVEPPATSQSAATRAACADSMQGLSSDWDPATMHLLRAMLPGMTPAQLDSLAVRHPPLTRLGVDDASACLGVLKASAAGLNGRHLAAVLRAQPSILTRPPAQLADTCAMLRQLLDAARAKAQPLAPLLRSCPRALLSDAAALHATCEALRRRGASLRPVLTKHFEAVTLPAAHVDAVLDFLDADVGCGARGAVELATAYPAVLSHSIERHLRPLLVYLTDELRVADPTLRELWANAADTERVLRAAAELLRQVGYTDEVLSAQPLLLCYSLEQRLHPRATLARRLVDDGQLASLPPLHTLAATSDAVFCVHVGYEHGAWKALQRTLRHQRDSAG